MVVLSASLASLGKSFNDVGLGMDRGEMESCTTKLKNAKDGFYHDQGEYQGGPMSFCMQTHLSKAGAVSQRGAQEGVDLHVRGAELEWKMQSLVRFFPVRGLHGPGRYRSKTCSLGRPKLERPRPRSKADAKSKEIQGAEASPKCEP